MSLRIYSGLPARQQLPSTVAIIHLASAVLTHRDPCVTEEHYNRAMSISAGEEYAIITKSYREHP
jgi:hypothetical protein